MRRSNGFTLVEIMVVTVIIGLLCAFAIPVFQRVREKSRNAAALNDLRVFSTAFQQYCMERGTWPDDSNHGQVPDGMGAYLKTDSWTADTPIGGKYDWDMGVFDVVAAISIYHPSANADQLVAMDQMIDDGDLTSGLFRSASSRVMYIIEE